MVCGSLNSRLELFFRYDYSGNKNASLSVVYAEENMFRLLLNCNVYLTFTYVGVFTSQVEIGKLLFVLSAGVSMYYSNQFVKVITVIFFHYKLSGV